MSNQAPTGETPTERLAKRMAACGLASRRMAEQWIADGRVHVNGKLVTTPATLVTDADQIVVDGVPLANKPLPQLWAYHKPTGLLTTHRDPQGRPTVFAQLPPNLGRVVSIGRLDINSEGLLLLTNSGAVARYCELPSTGLPRTYEVRAFGDWPQDMTQKLAKGCTIDGVHYGAIAVERLFTKAVSGKNMWLRLTLHEGKNREVRKVLAAFGLQVNRLIRTAYGPIALADLPPGQLRLVPPETLKTFLPPELLLGKSVS